MPVCVLASRPGHSPSAHSPSRMSFANDEHPDAAAMQGPTSTKKSKSGVMSIFRAAACFFQQSPSGRCAWQVLKSQGWEEVQEDANKRVTDGGTRPCWERNEVCPAKPLCQLLINSQSFARAMKDKRQGANNRQRGRVTKSKEALKVKVTLSVLQIVIWTRFY